MTAIVEPHLRASRPVAEPGPALSSMRLGFLTITRPVVFPSLPGDVPGGKVGGTPGYQGRAPEPMSPRSQTMSLGEELDAATAVVGRRELCRALETGGGPLVLDCSAVEFIDAAWLAVLVHVVRYGRRLGRRVIIGDPSSRVLRVLRLVGLEYIIVDDGRPL